MDTSRKKKIFDNTTEYQIYILEAQGMEEHNAYIRNVKCNFFLKRKYTNNGSRMDGKYVEMNCLSHAITPWRELTTK